MLRKTLLAAGLLVAVTIAGCASASASSRHSHVSPITHGSRHALHGSRRFARGRGVARPAGRHGAHYARLHRHGGRRLAARSATDATIQRYVGPRSAYALASTPDAVPGGLQTGRASFYGGGRTASGGRVGGATCAHRTLPFGTRVLVTNLVNARQAVLTVNDRGPFVRGRIVDVSVGAAGMLGMLHSGTAPVSVQVISGHG